ncbi:MAG: DUF429 domain-containing protein [Burkholderiales bacterium]|nr:DUF429 domain-containing protein [Burkholderiales bacterium]
MDFTSAPRRAKPITVARGRLAGDALAIDAIERLPDWASFEQLLARPGPWVGGLDFPFGLPRELVRDLGWPRTWPALVRHCAALGRERFRAALDAYRMRRPAGAKYAHRATDVPARSSSPMKLVNPPVGLMFFEGAPRLLAAGLAIPTLAPGRRSADARRVALETYPGLLARAITRAPYKNDAPAMQTAERAAARRRILATIRSNASPLGIRLEASRTLLRAMRADATGDTLDAALCALLAAWGWRRRRANYGMPHHVDPLECWIIGAGARWTRPPAARS